MRIPTPPHLACRAYTAYIASRAAAEGRLPGDDLTWVKLSPKHRAHWQAAATAMHQAAVHADVDWPAVQALLVQAAVEVQAEADAIAAGYQKKDGTFDAEADQQAEQDWHRLTNLALALEAYLGEEDRARDTHAQNLVHVGLNALCAGGHAALLATAKDKRVRITPAGLQHHPTLLRSLLYFIVGMARDQGLVHHNATITEILIASRLADEAAGAQT